MDHLWSPWRARHIERMTSGEAEEDDSLTLFERLADGADDESLIVYRGTTVFVVMNLYPYNNGHVMIAPLRKVADLDSMTVDERAELMDVTSRCVSWLRSVFNPDGFNVGMNLGAAGGAGVPDHLHMHVVPRWSGDTNFMPVIGQTKVIPEDIRETYRKIRAAADASVTSPS
jgi:ATP adenylyltransferase